MFNVTTSSGKTLKVCPNAAKLLGLVSTSNTNIKITASTLAALKNKSPDEVFESIMALEKKGQKRRLSVQNFESPEEAQEKIKCVYCGCTYLRVVSGSGNRGSSNVLECMRRGCLATVKLTDMPVGTVLGKPESYGYLDSCLERVYYPSSDDIESALQKLEKQRCSSPVPFIPEIVRDADGNIMIPVPGQKALARLL